MDSTDAAQEKSIESSAIDDTDATQEKFIDSINDTRDDDEAFTNLIKNDVSKAKDRNVEEDFLNWLLDDQALADDDAEEMEDNDDWDNLFDADMQEMGGNDFDDKKQFHKVLDEKHANVAGASGDKVETMSDDLEDTFEDVEDEENSNDTQSSRDDDQFADMFDDEIEEMSLDDRNSLFDMTNAMSDDSETGDFLKAMKAVDGKGSTDDEFKDFMDFIQSSDADHAGTENNYIEMEDDFVKLMSEVGDTNDNMDDDFSEFLDEVESSDLVDDQDEDDTDLDSLLAFAQKLTHTSEDTDPMNSRGGNLPVKESGHNDVPDSKSTVSTSGRMRRMHKTRRMRRMQKRYLRRLQKRSRKARRSGKRMWRRLQRSLYYRKYRSTLKKYYRLRKMYYSLKSKYRRVKKACKKTTFKLVSKYCKKVHKKMNNYSKVYSKVRGCRNRKKCKFYEKTTNTTRNYYKFMYKMRPTAVMCSKMIKQTKG